MGPIVNVKLALMAALLAAVALIVHFRLAPDRNYPPKPPLNVAIGEFPAWAEQGSHNLDPAIISLLNLDDYLFKTYRHNSGQLSLYIGYYRTAKKVGAAHDPLVCFQGQGWKIGKRTRGKLALATDPRLTISYSSMIAERSAEKELIVYWFQTNGVSSAGTFSQKIEMIKSRFLNGSEDNAFVRINTPVDDSGQDAALGRIFEFIEVFYPRFCRYAGQSEGPES